MSGGDQDEARRLVLARRARFVAAALAGASIACGKETAQPPLPCLSIASPVDASPRPCLEVEAPPADAADGGAPSPDDAGGAGGAGDAGVPARADAGVHAPGPIAPQPGPRPPPRPCLRVMPPKGK